MNIKDFFNLPQADQENIIRLQKMRGIIRAEADYIKGNRAKLLEQERDLQERCEHPAAKKTHRSDAGYEGTEYYTDYYCPDCDKRWTLKGTL